MRVTKHSHSDYYTIKEKRWTCNATVYDWFGEMAVQLDFPRLMNGTLRVENYRAEWLRGIAKIFNKAADILDEGESRKEK